MSAFPKTYAIVRGGRQQVVPVRDFRQLVQLRTELELVRRFGAGASPRLIRAIDRRIEGRVTHGVPSTHPGSLAELEEMRAILCDALSPVNTETLSEIDRDCPQAKAGVFMDSINKDAQEFREDLVEELRSDGDADVDALLAEFAEATQEVADEPGATLSDPTVDPDLEALLAEATGTRSPESELVGLAAELGDTVDPTSGSPDDVSSMLEQLGQVADEAAELSAATPVEAGPVSDESHADDVTAGGDEATPDIEAVTEQVAESLTAAEAQLDAIASAFEVAAAELGEVTGDVVDTVGPAVQPSQSFADDSVNLADWGSDSVGSDASSSPPSVSCTESAPAAFCAPVVGYSAGTASAASRKSDQMRVQLKQARTNILSELDDLLVMLERVDQMQVQADDAMARARQFEQAAAKAHAASQVLAAAEAEAASARAAFEQAQSRACGARQTWEQAQQEAAAAAAQTRFRQV